MAGVNNVILRAALCVRASKDLIFQCVSIASDYKNRRYAKTRFLDAGGTKNNLKCCFWTTGEDHLMREQALSAVIEFSGRVTEASQRRSKSDAPRTSRNDRKTRGRKAQ